jgi:alginate O-acetyltransferase complex protein AlgI
LLFNSYVFLGVFLPAALAAFYVLPRQAPRLAVLVLASYVFYAYAQWWFPALMVGSTAISFATGLLLARTPEGRTRKWLLATGIAGALSLLVFFKYAQFVTHNSLSFVTTITGRGLPSLEAFTGKIVLPIGISFFTFEAISYVIDVYRGDLEAERNPLRYAFFISFFPHLIAGPIVRYGKLRPQLEQTRWPWSAPGFTWNSCRPSRPWLWLTTPISSSTSRVRYTVDGVVVGSSARQPSTRSAPVTCPSNPARTSSTTRRCGVQRRPRARRP